MRDYTKINAWKAADDLTVAIYDHTRTFPNEEIYGLTSQIRRAAVSPYRATRSEVRSGVGENQFVEIFVDTPLEICEQRDIKGMYAKARREEPALMTHTRRRSNQRYC